VGWSIRVDDDCVGLRVNLGIHRRSTSNKHRSEQREDQDGVTFPHQAPLQMEIMPQTNRQLV
jgi:hypothetical protein